ncbi:phosphotransferase [Dickeya zeae]|uniref:phosphotransferase n=1 Tax=Dickeya zeae TaxID=204042 RepID=UPI000D7700CF|nr:phosphotransferase [Dickeya zeae]PXW44677.1 Ser/Thr protein kinase RdoA (MazF antagonist) [Erwinia sp. AG740]UJR62350.1 phosphotransferase [Dickeya zeae]
MSDPLVLFTTDVPSLSAVQAQQIARQQYGLDGSMTPLPGERDANFHLVTATHGQYMLKVINSAEPAPIRDVQTEILLHLARVDTTLPVPRIIRNRWGNPSPALMIDGQMHYIRLITWSFGQPLHRVSRSSTLSARLGDTLAQLDLALRDFSHPAASRDLLWDIAHLERIHDWLRYVENAQQRQLILQWLTHWETAVAPIQSSLRHQLIHNDLNPYNVLVDTRAALPRIDSIIDFGDALYAPLINELATALAYQVGDESEPLVWILPFVTAYHARLPLTEQEISLLPCLIAARLTLTLSITQWRSELYPENRDYIRRNLETAWRSLQHLSRQPEQRLADQLLHACR